MLNEPRFERQHSPDEQTNIKVMILVLDGVSLTTVSVTLEPFQHANALFEEEKFEIQLISLVDSDPVTSAGIPIPCHDTSATILQTFGQRDRPDLLILCCGQMLRPADQSSTQNFVRRLARANVPVFALGAGCTVIAKSAIVKEQVCAAHWKISAALTEQFPKLEFQNVLFVKDERASSCAGELAAFDLIVDFIERNSDTRISGEICNHFLSTGRRSGGTVQLLGGDAHICGDQRFQSALKIMVENIEIPVPIAEIARRLGYSTRQIERVFSLHGFESPNKYYVNLRLRRARQLIEQTQMSLSEIALACGFDTQSRLSKCYKRKFGVTPNKHRYCSSHLGFKQIAFSNSGCV